MKILQSLKTYFCSSLILNNDRLVPSVILKEFQLKITLWIKIEKLIPYFWKKFKNKVIIFKIKSDIIMIKEKLNE